MMAQNQDGGLASILERTRNLLANHRIIADSSNLSQLSLAAKRLAQRNQVSVEDEHAAQLFFAQRGWDLSKHIQNILTTQQILSPQDRNPVLDFDIDQYLENQQDLIISNLFQHTLDYHTIQANDIFSSTIADDWNSTKQNLISTMSFNVNVPNPTDPMNVKPTQQKLPLNITQPFVSLSATQDLYAQLMKNFSNFAHNAHQQKDLATLREVLLTLPSSLVDVSRALEQQERTAPLSTTNNPGALNNFNTTNFAQNTLYALKQHEQMTEFWLWFESLSSILTIVHENAEQGNFSSNNTVGNANGGNDDDGLNRTMGLDSTYVGGFDNKPNTTNNQPHYRYKNWFLMNKTEHAVIATVDYLQQGFVEHMTGHISQDVELSNEYNSHIQNVEDDDQLMIELVSIYCRSRDFKTRFIAQSYNNSTLNSSLHNVSLAQHNMTFNQTGIAAPNQRSSPNTEISRENLWSYIYCCVRSGYYNSAIRLLKDTLANTDHGVFYTDLNCEQLINVLQLYAQHQIDPTKECLIPPTLWSALFNEMHSPYGGDSHGAVDVTNTVPSNPFRKVVYAVLGHFPLTPAEMKATVTPYVLITIEDFIWYRLRLITQQTLPNQIAQSYRHLSQTTTNATISQTGTALNAGPGVVQSNGNLTEQLSLSNLQGAILARGKNYFCAQVNTGVNSAVTNPMLYVNILFLTQQYERAVVELYTINPTLGFHLALVCMLYGLIRITDANSDLLIPVSINLKAIQQLQQISQQTNQLTQQNGVANHLGLSLLYHTHHTRYAINMYKLIIEYIQATQGCNPAYAVHYAYLTRFLPLFANIHLYADYIQDADSGASASAMGKRTGQLTSIEHTSSMIFNPNIPKSILTHYHNIIQSLSSPISHIVLTHQQTQQLHNLLQCGVMSTTGEDDGYPNSANIGFDVTQLADVNNIALLLNSTTVKHASNASVLTTTTTNTSDLNGSVLLNHTMLNGGNKTTTGVSKTLLEFRQNVGVELPIVLDLLLINKNDSSLFLGPNQHLYNYKPFAAQFNNGGQQQQPGVLHAYYNDGVISTIVKIVVDRDNDKTVI